MIRLTIAIAMGTVIGTGATAVEETALSSAANGTPSTSSLHQYESR